MTAEQQMEQFSLAYVRAVAAVAGVNATKPDVDSDSVDLVLSVQSVADLPVSPVVQLQVKSHAAPTPAEPTFSFPLKLKNYNELRGKRYVPRYLVVVLLPADPADWTLQDEAGLVLRRCGYWLSLANEPPTVNVSSVTVTVPRLQMFTPVAVHGFFAEGA